MNKPLLAAVAACIACGTLLIAQDSRPASRPAEPPKVGKAPAFTFPKGTADIRVLESTPEILRMTREHGSKLLVVNFWATWCGPCVKEMPHFEKVWKESKDRDVQFVGLSTDFLEEWKEKVPAKLDELKITYPNLVVYVDPDELIRTFADEWTGAIPATFYFDAKGNKLGQRLGEVSEEDLRADVEKYLAAK